MLKPVSQDFSVPPKAKLHRPIGIALCGRILTLGLRGLLPVLLLLSTTWAVGAVRREGAWPETDKAISVSLGDVTRSEAVRRVAEAAGWNVIWSSPSMDRVDVQIKDQPAGKVLEFLLSDADYVLEREGDLIQIRRETAADPHLKGLRPAPSSSGLLPGKNPGKLAKGPDDRTLFGGSLRVESNETVGDVTVLGGSADILGIVTGNVSVFGGSTHVRRDAHVQGDAVTLGGTLEIEDGAVVDGDVTVLGGQLERAPGAKIGGEVQTMGAHVDTDSKDSSESPETWTVQGVLRNIGGRMTKTAMLFVLGAVLLALATPRMQVMQSEIAARPLRNLGLGVASLVAALVVSVLLCVTLIGIPVAVVGILFAILAAYSGICAVLTTLGGVLLGHKTQSPYLHLALGCALFLIMGFIPYLGGFVTALMVLVGIGAFVATRAAGFVAGPAGSSSGAAVL